MTDKTKTMIKRGRVTDASADGDITQVRQVETLGGKPKPTYIVLPYGLSANIPADATVIMLSVGGSGQDESGTPTMPENRFPNLKEWAVKIGNYLRRNNIHFDDDGDIVLNPNGTEKAEDWAVQYTELKAAFDELKADHNALVAQYNTFINTVFTPHIHQVAALPSVGSPPPTIPTITPTPPGTASTATSTADMSGSKVDKVRLP